MRLMDFAIIGFGGLGKLHFGNLPEIEKRVGNIRLVAICDVDEEAFYTRRGINLESNQREFSLSEYHLYTDVNELFEKEELCFVITALPTYLHEEIAVMAMERGIHVFSEKPMALSYAQGLHMLHVARENKVQLMIGQCVRYFPQYVSLKELVDSRKYGNVVKAEFVRNCATPLWSWEKWMQDEEKSGGAVLDLHVHDVDYINWIFGMPKAVSSYATNSKMKHESVMTVYHYEDKLVTAASDWGMTQAYPFTSGFTVRFEEAVAVTWEGYVKIYLDNGEEVLVEGSKQSGHMEELVDFISCIRSGVESTINPPEASLQSLKIALAEKESADTGIMVSLCRKDI